MCAGTRGGAGDGREGVRRLGVRDAVGRFRRTGLLAVVGALLLLGVILPSGVEAQVPPIEETLPSETGLGHCDDTMKVGVLNDDFNTLPEDLVSRHGNGGFEALITTNCIPVIVHWYVVDRFAIPVRFAEGTVDVRDKFDDVEWVFLGDIEYERHIADVYEDGVLKARIGDPVLDHNGNAIPIPAETVTATAYRYTLEFKNDKRAIGTEEIRPMVAEQDYALIFEVVPFDGAPANFIHEFTFEVIAKIGGQWWDKLLRILTPTYWIEKSMGFVIEGGAQSIQGGMCVVTLRTMEPGQIEALDRYDSDGDGAITVDDLHVENHDQPDRPNGNGNCKRPALTPEEELEEIRTAAYIEVNERRAIVGLPPIYPDDKRDSYVRQLFDGRDPTDRLDPTGRLPDASAGSGFGSTVSSRLSHVTLAPKIALHKMGLAPPAQVSGGGITTFTGLLTGTPSKLTYERGIVRLGWSAMMNVMVAVLVLIVAWASFTQILRSFLGNQRGMADWRELVPRLALAILAAVTSYWWCSLCVDLADGVSRYVAATMRVTPADITLTLGQAVLAIVLRSASGFALSFVPLGGILQLALKLMTNLLIMTLMLAYAMYLLIMIGQFVVRIVLINLLIIVSPLGMIMWALPETSGWGRRWVQQFGIALTTHSLQLVCFAMSTWMIREATPVGIVFETGSFPSAMQSLLPVQMIWALALGAMAAYLTTKIPSMLGAGGIYEGFQSVFTMAALGALALTFGMGGGGGMGGRMMGIFGGGGGGGAGGAGAMMSNLPGPARGIMAAVSAGDTVASGVMRGLGRGARNFLNPIGRGAGAAAQSVQSGDPGGGGGGGGSVQSSTGPGESGDFGDGDGGGGVRVSGRGPGPGPGQGPGQGPGPGPAAPSGQSVIPPRSAGVGDAGRVSAVMGQPYLDNAWTKGNMRAVNPGSIQEGMRTRDTTPQERALISEMGVGGFNRILGGGRGMGGGGGGGAASSAVGSSEPATPADAQQYSDSRRMRQGLGEEWYSRARRDGTQAESENTLTAGGRSWSANELERSAVQDIGVGRFNNALANPEISSVDGNSVVGANGVERPVTPSERSLIGRIGVGGFNEMMNLRSGGGRGASQGFVSQEADPAVKGPQEAAPGVMGPQVGDAERARELMGPGAFGASQNAGLKALNSQYVSDGGQVRAVAGHERQLIDEMGVGRFNAVFGGSEPPGGRVGDMDTARSVMGQEGYTQARLTQPRAIEWGNRVRVVEGGRTRAASASERSLVRAIGGDRFNSLFAPQGSNVESVRGPARAPQEAPDLSGPPPAPSASFSERAGAFGQGFVGGFGDELSANVRPTVRDVRTGRLSVESMDGMRARDMLGDEFGESAGRSINYKGEGSWMNASGRFVEMTSDEKDVRQAMGDDDAFRHTMGAEIRLSKETDPSTNLPWIVDDRSESDSGMRSATPAEAAAIMTVGSEKFERVAGASRQFVGDGVLVQDESARRMATGGETQLYNELGERRFNDVMGRRAESAGMTHVRQEPSVGDELRRAGGEARDLGRGIASGAGTVRERLARQEEPQGAYDDQSRLRSQGPNLRSQI